MGRQRALTEQQELRIKRLVGLRSKLTNVALAKRFGVSAHTITIIARNRRLELKLKRAGFPTSATGDV